MTIIYIYFNFTVINITLSYVVKLQRNPGNGCYCLVTMLSTALFDVPGISCQQT